MIDNEVVLKTAKDSGIKYKKRISELQKALAVTARHLKTSNRSLIVVFEGLDASGKSGCIRRLTRSLDTKQYRVIPISKPTEEEYRYHYLKRFWDRLPPYGNIAFFDRSWYGRVLVERVEELSSTNAWTRAWREINDFERLLTDDGSIIIKLWFDVSDGEQLKRFKARMTDPEKAHKITEEDWRNRSKREEYLAARDDMLRYTDTEYAPWIVIPSDDKKEARCRAAEEIISRADLFV